MQHMNLKLEAATWQTDMRARLGCATCGTVTVHNRYRKDGRTVYKCQKCGRKEERKGAVA